MEYADERIRTGLCCKNKVHCDPRSTSQVLAANRHASASDYARVNYGNTDTSYAARKRLVTYAANYTMQYQTNYEVLETESSNIQTALEIAHAEKWQSELIS